MGVPSGRPPGCWRSPSARPGPWPWPRARGWPFWCRRTAERTPALAGGLAGNGSAGRLCGRFNGAGLSIWTTGLG